MMMKNQFKTIVFALLLAFGLMLESCTKNEPGLGNVKMEMKATTALSSINPGGRTMATDLVFTEVKVGVTEIELETLEENQKEDSGEIDDKDGDGEDDNEDIEFEGEFVVDLLAGTSTPDFGVAEITPGVYEEIEMNLEPIMEGGLTMFIAFDYTPAGDTVAVRYEYSNNYSLEYELESDTGIEISDATANQLLVVFNLDALFAGVDLDAATADSDGVVRINDSSNADLSAQIADNLDSVMEGGEDDDGDGEFDD